MLRFRCPKCGTELAASPSLAGRTVKCQCGQAMVVQAMPAPLPASRTDKTALGQPIAHTPTSIKPVSAPEKTALGKMTAHKPTTVESGREGGRSQRNRNLPELPAVVEVPIRNRPWWARSVTVLILLFTAGGIFAGGLVFYLRSREATPASLASNQNPGSTLVSQVEQPPPSDSSPTSLTETPTKDAQKSPSIAKTTSPLSVQQEQEKIPPKTPKPQNEKLPPPQQPQSLPGLSAEISTLRTGNEDQKMRVAEKIGLLGQKAKAASSALCEAALSTTKEISRTALIALEKVNPEIHASVFTLIVDGEAENHLKATLSLRSLGEKAKPAFPVLVQQIRKRLSDLESQIRNRSFSGRGWQPNAIVQVTMENLITLAAIAPEESDSLQTMIEATRFSLKQPFGQTRTAPFRDTGINVLGRTADKVPGHRTKILAELEALLEESVQNLSSTDKFVINSQLGQIDQIGNAMLQCGSQAKDRLVKKVVPQLKELEFHKDASVRSVAKGLRLRIETGATLPIFPITDQLTQALSQRAYPVSMQAGKSYIIELRSQEFDAFLKLHDASGRLVAQDDDSGGNLNARIVFPCPESGRFTIDVSALGGSGAGTFVLSVREQ